MNLGDALKRATPAAWTDAVIWLVLNIFMVVFPVGFTYLFVLGNSGEIVFQQPISHGELPLFSISLLGSGAYVILTGLRISGADRIKITSLRDALRNVNFPGSKYLYPAILIQALIATGFFVTSFTLNPNLANYELILNARITLTEILMGSCFITTFVITLADASIKNKPPTAEEMFDDSDNLIQRELKKKTWRSK